MQEKDIYTGIEEHFEAMLSREGRERMDEKRTILTVFMEITEHCTVKDIARRLQSQGASLPEDFIGDVMESFCQFGIARKRQFQGQEVLYEHLHPGRHHDHLVCVQCGRIIEFADHDMEEIQSQVAREKGFYPLHHLMELYGLCSACFAFRKPVLPLAQASPGERLRIERLLCGHGMASRLHSLGLTTGTHLEVIGNEGVGPVLVAVRGTRFGLGREMASKIMVSPVSDGDSRHGAGETEAAVEHPGGPARKEVAPQRPLVLNLSMLREGERGIIKRILGRGYFRHRLMEMGFTPGSEVYVEKYAPLKDPIEYVIKGYHVSLRRDEAANIIVEPKTS